MGGVFAKADKVRHLSTSSKVVASEHTDTNQSSSSHRATPPEIKQYQPSTMSFDGIYEAMPILCRDEFISKYTREITYRWRDAVIQEYLAPEVRIHFVGWSEKHDVWLNLHEMSDLARLAQPGSLSDHFMANGLPLSEHQIVNTVKFMTSQPVSSEDRKEEPLSTDALYYQGSYTVGEAVYVEYDNLSRILHIQVDVQDFYKSSDHRKIVSKWRQAVIKEVSGKLVRVGYVGWDSSWDEVLDVTTSTRIRPAGSMTSLQSEKRTRRSFDDLAYNDRSAVVDEILSHSDPYHRKQHKSLVRTRSYPPVARIESAEAIFTSRLQAIGLHIIRVDGDGNCLFRAVAHQLYLDESRHIELRTRCVQHMKEHWERYKSFCDSDFDAYLRSMEVSGTWGDNLEIYALEEVLDRFICIYSSEGKEVKPMKIHFDDDFHLEGVEPILLTYHGQSHYNSLFNEKCPLPLQSRSSKLILENRLRGSNGSSS